MLWNRCGKSVEGDGDMGPPDGWCYEGKHNTDTKRARFRADSTLYDDKLRGPRIRRRLLEFSITPSRLPRKRKRKRSTRKREEQEAAVEQNEDLAATDDANDARTVTSTFSQSRKKKLKGAPPAEPSSLASVCISART
ncbi:hypothetical protein GYMLUDRAFT_60900 [Collybiopsis luxurians FD-317 M1]|uniref:Unplaced genomic scaffold GYMLUscaffold_39, whole genome shotgun sequence n=1 Tax=Collybiopsis luxurians FD-317 M1 TaxID=944289 RepID=A0A0D0CID0_9AGAR|nr:hypothetical protein GYMLUDRAFT_60900 [Collybiopsis luxurians FD-317 M1]